MSRDSYRSIRRLLSPLHPRKLWSKARYVAHLLGWHHLRLWLSGLRPRRLAASWRLLRRQSVEIKARRHEQRLTVAVDISPFWEPLTGIGWYLYRLLQAMADRDDVRLRLYGPGLVDKGDTPDPVIAIPEGRALERVQYRIPEDFSIVWYWLTDRLRPHEERLIAFDRNQVLFAPNYYLPERFGRCDGHLVATIHDLSVLVVPETMRESTREVLSRQLKATAEKAALVLTDSKAVEREIIAEGLAEPHRVRAVHLAPGSTLGVEPQIPEGLPRRYVLFVGTIEPRKNLETLLAAFSRLRPKPAGRDADDDGSERLSLVLCGGLGWKTETSKELIEEAERAGWCRRMGYLTEPELVGVYSRAEWVALPSLYEGFGLPAVEAMAVGVPLLLADIPVLREVGGDSALYAPSRDQDAWLDLLTRIDRDPSLRAKLSANSKRRSEEFSWQKTSDSTAEAWRYAVDLQENADHGS